VHKTHVGGICSIISAVLIGFFTFGLLNEYFQYNTFDSKTFEEYSVQYEISDCRIPAAKCMTMNNT
jgi:hypothetical protein